MWYSIYNPETMIITHCVWSEQQPPHSTTVMVTERMAKPLFDPVTNTVTNIATEQEQADYINSFLTDSL